MSAETLKFFEDKSTEEIINWMIQHLSEEQIKLCLDTADIKPPVSDSPAAASLSEASGSGEGSSSEPLPGSSQEPISSVTDVSDMFSGMDIMPLAVGKATKQNVATRIVNNLRKRCLKRPFVIIGLEKPTVGPTVVKYFDFNIIEEEDLILNPGAELGDVNWIVKTQPQAEFIKEHCNDEDKESLEELLSFDDSTVVKYNNPPPEVIEVIKDYISQEIESPIEGLDLSKIEGEAETPFRFNDTLKKALIRQKTTCALMQKDYPLLYSKNARSVPFFIYDYEGDATVKFYYAKFEDGSLKLIDDKKPIGNLPLIFKMKTRDLEKELANGNYVTDDLSTDLQNLVDSLPAPVWDQLTALYSKDFLGSLTAFGMDHEWEMINDDDTYLDDREMPLEDPVASYDEVEMPELTNLSITRPPARKGIARQIADGELTEEQIREHMYKLFGPRAENLTYELYRPLNSPEGTVQIKYISNDKSSIIDPEFNAELLEADKFIGFQGQPDVNAGPGRFGDDEPLLFGDEYSNFNGVDADPEMSHFGTRPRDPKFIPAPIGLPYPHHWPFNEDVPDVIDIADGVKFVKISGDIGRAIATHFLSADPQHLGVGADAIVRGYNSCVPVVAYAIIYPAGHPVKSAYDNTITKYREKECPPELTELIESQRGTFTASSRIIQQVIVDRMTTTMNYSDMPHEEINKEAQEISRNMIDKNVNEQFLYHGTNSVAALAGIIRNGFLGVDPSMPVKSGSMLGKGNYFAESIEKIDQYAKPLDIDDPELTTIFKGPDWTRAIKAAFLREQALYANAPELRGRADKLHNKVYPMFISKVAIGCPAIVDRCSAERKRNQTTYGKELFESRMDFNPLVPARLHPPDRLKEPFDTLIAVEAPLINPTDIANGCDLRYKEFVTFDNSASIPTMFVLYARTMNLYRPPDFQEPPRVTSDPYTYVPGSLFQGGGGGLPLPNPAGSLFPSFTPQPNPSPAFAPQPNPSPAFAAPAPSFPTPGFTPGFLPSAQPSQSAANIAAASRLFSGQP